MKILEITRSYYPSIGGMEKFVSDRLNIYEKLGYDYKVITTTHSEKKLANSKNLRNVVYLPSHTPYEIVPSLVNALETDYDVLSINQLSYYYSWQAVNKAWKQKKKIIITPHFFFHTEKYKLIKTLHAKFIVPKILGKVDKLICFTKYEAEFWSRNFPFIENNIEIIPHYFHKEIPKFKHKGMETKYLLYLGRGNKRTDLLIKSFHQIKADYQLLLTLEADELADEQKKIVSLDNRIKLTGRVFGNEKENLLFNSEAVILPTDSEAFGIVNFESSFYKKPLLLSNLTVFQEILPNEGVIYFNNSVESIRKAIEEFISLDKNQKIKMGEANYNNLKKYSFEKIAGMYKKLFDEL